MLLSGGLSYPNCRTTCLGYLIDVVMLTVDRASAESCSQVLALLVALAGDLPLPLAGPASGSRFSGLGGPLHGGIHPYRGEACVPVLTGYMSIVSLCE